MRTVITIRSGKLKNIPVSIRDAASRTLKPGSTLVDHYYHEFQVNCFLGFYPGGSRYSPRHSEREENGLIVFFPKAPELVLELPERPVYRKIIKTGRFV
jgi:hypothetical protein